MDNKILVIIFKFNIISTYKIKHKCFSVNPKSKKFCYCTQKSGYKSRYINLKVYLKVFAWNTVKNMFRIVCIIIFNKQKITLIYLHKMLIYQGYFTNFILLNADCQNRTGDLFFTRETLYQLS